MLKKLIALSAFVCSVVALADANPARLIHRWSFNGDLNDSVGGCNAMAVGNATTDGVQYFLPGGSSGSAYIDLGDNLVPCDVESVTLEFWATHLGSGDYGRVFDLGSLPDGYRFGSYDDYSTDNIRLFWDGSFDGTTFGVRGWNMSQGTEYHVAAVFANEKSSNRWTLTIYVQDAAGNGSVQSYKGLSEEGWSFSKVGQTEWWLGQPLTLWDGSTESSYNEARIWNGVLTEELFTTNGLLGSDKLPSGSDEESEKEKSFFTIRFDSNEGTVTQSEITRESGTAYGTLPTATRDGYTFDGWYTALSGGEKVSLTTMVTGDVTLYAHWIVVSGEVYFRGQKITYTGAEIKWIGDPSSKDSELVFVYKDTETPGIFAPSAGVEARVVAIGGGGAGGTVRSTGYNNHAGGGGGGAGEFLDRKGFSIAEGVYQIVVGKGGVASEDMSVAKAGGSGQPSQIISGAELLLTVNGGGGGGAESLGADGGSGGGGSYACEELAGGGKSSCYNKDGIGTNGGDAVNRYAGGGGGVKGDGASGSGSGSSGTSGTGGAGITIDELVPDMVLTIGGGGGGGTTYTGKTVGGTGGSGGGGSGAGANNSDASVAIAGKPNTGSGGGGGGRYKPGADGGSGIVIIRVTYIEQPINWKAHTVAVGDRTGTFYVDDRAEVSQIGADYVITYKDVDSRGGLRVGDVEHPMVAKARVLAVGGGGGGGVVNARSGGGGGGGGGGGYVEASEILFNSVGVYQIVVGAGGKGGVPTSTSSKIEGGDGGNTTLKLNGIDVITPAIGGGGGGANSNGRDGGCGGGGSRGSYPDTVTGSYERQGGVGSQGCSGGSTGAQGTTVYRGAGGGGAGGDGYSTRAADNGVPVGAAGGGIGKSCDITGEPVYYAGGGGGAYVNSSLATQDKYPRGLGGLGGGGNGGGCEGLPSLYVYDKPDPSEGYRYCLDKDEARVIAAENGVDGLGGGGGGGGAVQESMDPAGNGGSGVVIIRLSSFEIFENASITYSNLKGATHSNPATYLEGAAVVLVAPSAVEGYTFAGWSPAEITAEMRGDQVVTANWTANTYTIAYNANGGSGTMAGTSAAYDQDATLAACAFAREGYTFVGWATEQTTRPESAHYRADDTVRNLSALQGGVVTLYAVWEEAVPVTGVRVTAVTAQQRYPWNGLVDITVTMQGTAADLADYQIVFAATNSVTGAALPIEHVTQTGVDSGSGKTWTRKFIWDATADVGEVKIADVALTVDAKVRGVQLWENGPYWAECNVGATKPEDFGYYFWWGDTVGYQRNAANNGWVSVKDGSSFSFSDGNCPTYGKSNTQLQSAGYIDATGNLIAAHDAATAHLGAPWRLPTDAEFAALISNCDTQWTVQNGVYGRLVTGRGAYAEKSIFLPAAGYGYGSYLFSPGSSGLYWSSAPFSGYSNYAWSLDFASGNFNRYYYDRYYGQSVRPVRGFAQ